MKIRINGEQRELPEGATIGDMLDTLEITPRGIAVEVNREIVPKGLHGETPLNDGDAVEVIRMVGGG